MAALDLARRLLAEPDPEPALDLCAEHLAEAGLEVTGYPEIGAIVARRGTGGVAFSGHVDVVPVALEAWSRDPFAAESEAGRLYGRGASDMRGPVACILAAAERTSAPVQVAVTTDEETTMAGARRLVEQEALASADVIVVGEPTQLDVAVAGKGLIWARVETEGARGHASTPRGPEGRGPSAAERLVEALAELEPRPLKIEHPRLGPATLAVSGLESEPTPFNVLAGNAEARLDVRFPPPKTPDDVERALASRLDLPREGLSLSLEKREPAFLGSEAACERARRVLEDAGVPASLTGVDYVSEAGHWQRTGDTLVCGPGSIERAHAPGEYIEHEELAAGTRAYEALIEAWGSTGA